MEYSDALLTALRRTFSRWSCALDGDHVQLTYMRTSSSYWPPRRAPGWADLLTTLTDACTDYGIQRHSPLPMTGLGEAELTFSAIQALDPYLKQGRQHVHAHGFLPQPVVRFTARRDERNTLLPGYATSFVNTSIVEPIGTVDDHTALIDAWIGVLSKLGFHARHLSIGGRLTVWRREPVRGITLRIYHEGRALGDTVLLWNQSAPAKLATDIGTGLERLRWLRTRCPWSEVVHGAHVKYT
ncbi:MAG: hypothetical protein ACRDQZ_16310, partial [Mycobacteriales bacterium]